MVKPFNKKTYNTYDKKAKKALLTIIGNARINPDKYGPDIVQEKYNRIIYHEVEIKVGWEDEWPMHWNTVDLPERKIKLISYCDNLVFWVINKNITKAWGIDSNIIRKENEVIIGNKMVNADDSYFEDKFIRVPLKFCILKNLRR